MPQLLKSEQRLQGSPICSGIAIGTPYFYARDANKVPDFTLSQGKVRAEVTRYRRAVARCRRDVKLVHRQLLEEEALEGAAILDTHIELLQDPLITERVEEAIIREKRNAEAVFHELLAGYEEKFMSLDDPFFQERFGDILDVGRRVLSCLNECAFTTLADVPKKSIVFSDDLAPSDAAEAKSCVVGAFVTSGGGSTSHAAIVARAKGIPFVAGVKFRDIKVTPEDSVIVDGRTGDIILNPSGKTLERYLAIKDRLDGELQRLEQTASLFPETYDGYSVHLSANTEMVGDFDTLQEYGSGIGLFRSEFIVMKKESFPSEEEQFRIYKRLVEKMHGLPVVIRTFDIGGDKLLDGCDHEGYRSIRLMLKEKDIFKTQLRALLRAAAYGDVKIMFPMVAGPAELRKAKDLLGECRKELRKQGVKVANRIKVGCMIEVPSAALICDVIAGECDFLSIGTNDLVQFSLALDRGVVTDDVMYSPTHPSVIRMIKMVVSEGARHDIPVSVCGEVAADPKFTQLLLGLGVRELSIAMRYIPVVKDAIRRTSIVDAHNMAQEVLQMKTALEIEEFLIARQEVPVL